jgi:hypothetical protein
MPTLYIHYDDHATGRKEFRRCDSAEEFKEQYEKIDQDKSRFIFDVSERVSQGNVDSILGRVP